MDSTSKRCVRKDQANAYLRTELEALAFDEIAIQTILHWPHSLMIRLQEGCLGLGAGHGAAHARAPAVQCTGGVLLETTDGLEPSLLPKRPDFMPRTEPGDPPRPPGVGEGVPRG